MHANATIYKFTYKTAVVMFKLNKEDVDFTYACYSGADLAKNLTVAC